MKTPRTPKPAKRAERISAGDKELVRNFVEGLTDTQRTRLATRLKDYPKTTALSILMGMAHRVAQSDDAPIDTPHGERQGEEKVRDRVSDKPKASRKKQTRQGEEKYEDKEE